MLEQEFADIEQVKGFVSFVMQLDWRDPWLIGLFVFHFAIFIMAIFTRNYGNFQALLFFLLLLLVYFTESINNYLGMWKIFSRQALFDSDGLFIAVVYSMPILLNCMLMVGSWLYQSTQLMKNLKMAQLRERIKIEKQQLEANKKVD